MAILRYTPIMRIWARVFQIAWIFTLTIILAFLIFGWSISTDRSLYICSPKFGVEAKVHANSLSLIVGAADRTVNLVDLGTIDPFYDATKFLIESSSKDHSILGIAWGKVHYDDAPNAPIRFVRLPLWIVAPISLLLLIQSGRGLVRSLKRRPGQCRSCGYDLRATPDRCPECGTTHPG
jgi:hypothetical protein